MHSSLGFGGNSRQAISPMSQTQYQASEQGGGPFNNNNLQAAHGLRSRNQVAAMDLTNKDTML